MPIVPGTDARAHLSDAELIAAAADVGFPLLVKAAAGEDCYALPAAEGWECYVTRYVLPAAEGWECYALPAARWDGIATPYLRRRDGNVTHYRQQGGMGFLRPTAAEGWECYALPAAGWDGIATPNGRRRDGNVTPYRQAIPLGPSPSSNSIRTLPIGTLPD